MPRRCEGRGRYPDQTTLTACTYDAGAHSRYCFFHEAVSAGLITDIAGDPKALSWRPRTPSRPDPDPADPLAALLRDLVA